jgi:hypothetical protein
MVAVSLACTYDIFIRKQNPASVCRVLQQCYVRDMWVGGGEFQPGTGTRRDVRGMYGWLLGFVTKYLYM